MRDTDARYFISAVLVGLAASRLEASLPLRQRQQGLASALSVYGTRNSVGSMSTSISSSHPKFKAIEPVCERADIAVQPADPPTATATSQEHHSDPSTMRLGELDGYVDITLSPTSQSDRAGLRACTHHCRPPGPEADAHPHHEGLKRRQRRRQEAEEHGSDDNGGIKLRVCGIEIPTSLEGAAASRERLGPSKPEPIHTAEEREEQAQARARCWTSWR